MKLMLIFFICWCYAVGQSTGEQWMSNNKNTIYRNRRSTSYGEGIPGECDCVPYYLCNKGTTINNGAGVIDISKIDNEANCHYLAVCCKPEDKREADDPIKPTFKKSQGCGVRHPEGVGFSITGDKHNEAQCGEFPWVLAVLYENPDEDSLVYQCGASLIHPQVALTAVKGVSEDKKFKVRAGEWDTQTKLELFPYQERDVASIKLHPDFKAGTLTNDVALLFLNKPFEITENVDVICLPPPLKYPESGIGCFISEWGKNVFGVEGKSQVILKKFEVPVVDRTNCQEQLRESRLSKYFQLHETLICAGVEQGKSSCKGDEGSALVCPVPGHPGKYEQHGIVSWKLTCKISNVPEVYSSVAKAVDWIKKELKSHNYDL